MPHSFFSIVLLSLAFCSMGHAGIFNKKPKSSQGQKKKNDIPVEEKLCAKKANGTVSILSAETLKKNLESSEDPVILDVYAPWCPPCKQMAPRFEQAAKEFSDSVIFAKIEIKSFENDPAIAALESMGVKIRAIPTFLYFEKGKVVKTIEGALSTTDLTKQVRSLVPAKNIPTAQAETKTTVKVN